MFKALQSPYLVPFDGSFQVDKAPTSPPSGAPGKQVSKAQLDEIIKEIRDLQDVLYARDWHSVLLIFQAMDAAGKDGTVRAVMSGINPAGCQVYSFKTPSKEELDHDFMWRTNRCLPERGRIGIFNRSYYEEVLIVKVHPELLAHQQLPGPPDLDTIWQQRYESILASERHLALNGTVILKFWLNISKAEQKKRFLARIDEPEKHWKFSSGDVRERQHWNKYMSAYEDALNATSRPWAPWYAIPADNKSHTRVAVADIVARTLKSLGLVYPTLGEEERAKLAEMRSMIMNEDP